MFGCSNRRHKASKSYVIQCMGVPRAYVKLYVQMSMTQSSAVDHTRHGIDWWCGCKT